MKKFLFVLIAISLIILPKDMAFSQSPTENEEQDVETIERIKDLVASKVAELDLVERRGIFGIVKSTGNTQLTLTDHSDTQRVVDIDELTEFDSDDDDDFGISDIDNGDTLSIVGLYNKDNERMLARFISVVNTIPENIDGKIVSIDEDEFTLNVISSYGQEWTVDIETSTDIYLYTDGETEESGFSQFETGQRIIIIGFEDNNDTGVISGSRIIHFSDIPPSSTATLDIQESEDGISSESADTESE